jgi:hypothetical protein
MRNALNRLAADPLSTIIPFAPGTCINLVVATQYRQRIRRLVLWDDNLLIAWKQRVLLSFAVVYCNSKLLLDSSGVQVNLHDRVTHTSLMRPVDIMTDIRWIAFTHLAVVWKIHELRIFRTSITTSVGPDGNIWRSRADLQEVEYGLNLASDKQGWNLAPGGTPQTAYMISHQLLETLSWPEVVLKGRTRTERYGSAHLLSVESKSDPCNLRQGTAARM